LIVFPAINTDEGREATDLSDTFGVTQGTGPNPKCGILLDVPQQGKADREPRIKKPALPEVKIYVCV